MEDINMDTSLSSIIDPLAEAPSQVDAPMDSQDTLPAEPPTTAVETDDQARAPTVEDKRRGVVPGSEKDYRRREANRLAAERSRIRAQEKYVTLKQTSKSLMEENERLKREIREAELESGIVHTETAPSPVPISRQQPASTPPVRGSGIGVNVGVGDTGDARIAHGTNSNHHDEHLLASSSEAQDSHSRTILAALMSGAVDDAFGPHGTEEEWMKGVEDMFKEAESSGRLGELAAVAAGQEDDEDLHHLDRETAGHGESPAQDHANAATPEQNDKQSEHEPASNTVAVEVPVTGGLPQPLRKLGFNADTAAAATSSAVAVAINAEVERLMRDDIAVTRATTMKYRKQILRLKNLQQAKQDGDDVKAAELEAEVDEEVEITSLPSAIFADDPSILRAVISVLEEDIIKTQNGLAPLREEVFVRSAEKVSEEANLASVIDELQDLDVEANDEQRYRMMSVLKTIRGYVGTLLANSHSDEISASGQSSSYSAAFAHRKRGRPPKSQTMINYQQALLNLAPNATFPSPLKAFRPTVQKPDKPEPSPAKGKGKGKGKASKKRSQLSQHLVPEEKGSPAPAENSAIDVNSAEQYILSHLQNSSSFADFLPESTSDMPAEASGSRPAEEDEAMVTDEVDAPLQTVSESKVNEEPTTPLVSVLSRLKKGGPGSCDVCGRTETSVWRKLTLGGEDLRVCNACGLYHLKFKVIRPPELWGDGRSLKKRRASTKRVKAKAVDEDDAEPKPKKKRARRTASKKAAPADGTVPGNIEGEGEGEGGPTENNGNHSTEANVDMAGSLVDAHMQAEGGEQQEIEPAEVVDENAETKSTWEEEPDPGEMSVLVDSAE